MGCFNEKLNYEYSGNVDSVLHQVPLFKDLTDFELEYIETISEIQEYKKGDIIICKQTKDTNLFVLLEGEVAIYPELSTDIDECKTVYSVKKMELFGEISFIFNLDRIASAISKTNSKVIEIDGKRIKAFMDSNVVAGYKILLNVSRSVSKKLNNTNKKWGTLSQENEKISSKKLEKETFYRIASHEMKSPVSGVSSILKTIKYMYEDTLSPRIMGLINRAEKKMDNTIQIINDLFLLSEDGTISRDEEHTSNDFIEVAKRILVNEKDRLVDKEIEVVENYDHNTNPAITACSNDLSIIFSNIISNSIRYSHKKSEIVLKNYLEDEFYCLSIKDQGIGMKKEDINKIGKDFFRAANAKSFNRDGTGLGMSIVQKLLFKYGGKMEIKSELGNGSEFIVKFKRPDEIKKVQKAKLVLN